MRCTARWTAIPRRSLRRKRRAGLATLARLEDRIWLVVDDVHELAATDALAQLELLVMRAPPELRFVLATRHDLRLGLHRLRLAGELTEIRAADRGRMMLWPRGEEAGGFLSASTEALGWWPRRRSRSCSPISRVPP